MVGKRVKSYARENERRLGRELGFRPLFPLVSHRFFFPRQIFARALLSERLEQATLCRSLC